MSFLTTTLDHPLSATAHTVELANGVSMTLLDTGVLRISPVQTGDYRIVISCGVHGNETAPIEIVDQLVNEIQQGELAVAHELLLIIGNPQAIIQESRFVEENLNRLFSGKHRDSSSQEASRAQILEYYVDAFFQEGDEHRLHYDLHTAIRGSELEKFAVYPYLHQRNWSRSQIGFLEYCGIDAILLSNKPAGTFSYYSSHQYGADAFTIELGKVHRFGENDMGKFRQITRGLKELISSKENFNRQPSKIQIFTVVEEVIKRSEDFKLHIEDKAKNFTAFAKGTVLASDIDYQYQTKQDGERFVFPISNVPIGQRAMLVVAPTKL